MVIQRYFDEICRDVKTPNEEEIKQYYEENPDQFQEKAKRRVSHIELKPPHPDDKEVYSIMLQARKEIKEGTDFGDVARKYSGCGDDGGDLGFVAEGQTVPEFEAVIFSLDIDEVSPIFLTEYGFHIAKVSETQPSAPTKFGAAREQIKKTILANRKNDAIEEKVLQLEKEAVVEED